MKKRVSITDIARECGVGLGTASRAINGKPGVKENVRRKVLNYIEEIGWRCNSIELRFQLPTEGRPVIFIAPTSTFESRFNTELLRLLMEVLPGEGLSPTVYYGCCRENLERAIGARPYAVVLAGVSDYQAPLVENLVSGGTHVIALGECKHAACPLVFPDPIAGAKRAVELLHKAGHKRIGFLGGMGIREELCSLEEVNIHFVRQLLIGICEAAPDFSLKESAVSDCFSELRYLRKQLKSGRHTAWICSDEKMCRQFLYCAHTLNVSIPNDVSLISFTPDLPSYAFTPDVTRLFPDNTTQVNQIIRLLSLPTAPEAKRVVSDFLLHKGTTINRARNDGDGL